MKTMRFLLAAAVVAVAAACSADVTTPERRAPVNGPSLSEADTTGTTPKAAEATGALGSGGGK